jgi:hypothetical protein
VTPLTIRCAPEELDAQVGLLRNGQSRFARGRWRVVQYERGTAEHQLELEPLDETAYREAAACASAVRFVQQRQLALQAAHAHWLANRLYDQPQFSKPELRAAGEQLTVGELRAWLEGIPDSFTVDYAGGASVFNGCVEIETGED